MAATSTVVQYVPIHEAGKTTEPAEFRGVDEWNLTLSMIKIARNPHHFKKLYKAHRCSREGLTGKVEGAAMTTTERCMQVGV
jgi:hypothetical protein